MDIRLEWEKDLRFRVTSPSHTSAVLDGDRDAGLSPMENLLASLCGCMAIDVVTILQKMRLGLQSLEVTAQGERNAEPPRYYRKIELTFFVKGELPRERVEHAIQLSFDRYCSVFHTLRQDLEVSRRLELNA